MSPLVLDQPVTQRHTDSIFRGARILHASEYARFIDPKTGIRYYPVPTEDPNALIALPGATSVLSSAQPKEERQSLENWRQREIEAGRDPEAGAKRGTRVHALLENYIRGVPLQEETEEIHNYYSGMHQHLDSYQSFLWNERPLRQGWEHCWSVPMPADGTDDPDRIARVWSRVWGFAGTPDVIGTHKRGLTVLGDFKTSTRPYYRPNGSRVPQYAEIGYKKYKKTVRQLCAYKLAIKELFDLHIDKLQIIIGLPETNKSQMFYVDDHEVEVETETIKHMASAFWSRHTKGFLELDLD